MRISDELTGFFPLLDTQCSKVRASHLLIVDLSFGLTFLSSFSCTPAVTIRGTQSSFLFTICSSRPLTTSCPFTVLGGLLSAHQFASSSPSNPRPDFALSWYNGELLHLAEDLGKRLLPAFRTLTGIPYARVSFFVSFQTRRDLEPVLTQGCLLFRSSVSVTGQSSKRCLSS